MGLQARASKFSGINRKVNNVNCWLRSHLTVIMFIIVDKGRAEILNWITSVQRIESTPYTEELEDQMFWHVLNWHKKRKKLYSSQSFELCSHTVSIRLKLCLSFMSRENYYLVEHKKGWY